MSELQATVEFSVELYKFYNVDLFQRGFYQIRTSLRVSPKLSVKIEANIVKNQKSEYFYPACTVNGVGVSKTFQILYRNEEVLLDDAIMFRAHLLVDSHKIEETLERADFTFLVELWFTEQTYGPSQITGCECVSTRTLQLNFQPTKGLHYHLPVLFDYFHLAAVTMTVHATLVALHQPFINTPRSAKPLFGNSYRLHSRHPQTVDTLFFENVNSTKCVSSSGTRLAHAKHVHQEVCSILLATYDALQTRLEEYMKLLPAWQQLKFETSDYLKRINNLSDFAKECHRNLLASKNQRATNGVSPSVKSKLVDVEEDFVSLANSDIAQLCAENILLWQQFLETFTCKDSVHQHLAKHHHHLRVKRFAEAFFVVDNPRQSAAGCYDANYQNYLAVSEMVRRSRYLSTLPPLPIMCVELDGDLTTMPIIFEDQYQDMAEFVRRRSGGTSKKSGSDPFLNTLGEKLLKHRGNEDECSCGIVAILESRSHKLSEQIKCKKSMMSGVPRRLGVLGIEEESVDDSGKIVTATLTLGTRSTNTEMIKSISTLPLKYPGHSSYNKFINTLENMDQLHKTRHSKSLDQLKNTGLTNQNGIKNQMSPQSAPNPSPSSYNITRSVSTNITNIPKPLRTNLKLDLKPVHNAYVGTSPSTDSESLPIFGVNKKLEQSLSVPYNLCQYPSVFNCKNKHGGSTLSMPNSNELNREIVEDLKCLVGNSSESMPNLVQSPDSPKLDVLSHPKEMLALYKVGDSTIVEEISNDLDLKQLEHKSPKFASLSSPPSSSISDDITSEQSGWVSNSSRHSSGSRSSSGAISPEGEASMFVKDLPDYSTLKMQQQNTNREQQNGLDGDTLIEKLEKLAVCSTPSNEHVYEDLQVLPPQQFRDIPPPPESFRDPPPTQPNYDKHSGESVDNLLYHVYEGVKEANRKENEKQKQKNFKSSLENLMYDLVKDSRRRRINKRKQGKDRASTVTTDEGFDESETKYSMNDSDTSTVDSFQLNDDENTKNIKSKNPFEGYLLKQDIETLKKIYEEEKAKHRGESSKSVDNFDLYLIEKDLEYLRKQNEMGDKKEMRVKSATLGRESKKDCDCFQKEEKSKRLVEDDTLTFIKAKEEFKRQMNFTGMIYSDFPTLASTLPYFHISDEYRIFSPEGLHLIVCVHGLDGNSADLRLLKTYLELGLPGANLEFLMSERNQGDTFSDFDIMTDKLVSEILYHVDACGLTPSKISFIGHSLGNIIIRSAITRPQMKHLLPRFHTFLSLSGPHLGTLYNNSGLVNMGMWFMQKWKKSGSLLQLALRDTTDMRQSFLYRLSQKSNLQCFRHVLLCGSSQDRYVPMHSARIELCKTAIKDTSIQGAVYREMVHNIMYPIISSTDTTLVRYDVHHALPNTANSLIGRAAHIAVLDSELFIEKFLVVTGLKYFR